MSHADHGEVAERVPGYPARKPGGFWVGSGPEGG